MMETESRNVNFAVTIALIALLHAACSAIAEAPPGDDPLPALLNTTEKGNLGEDVTDEIMRQEGFEKLPSHYKGNQGFDGVYVKKAPNGTIKEIVLTETKTDSSLLKPDQLSDDGVNERIKKMRDSKEPEVRKTGKILDENRDKIRKEYVHHYTDTGKTKRYEVGPDGKRTTVTYERNTKGLQDTVRKDRERAKRLKDRERAKRLKDRAILDRRGDRSVRRQYSPTGTFQRSSDQRTALRRIARNPITRPITKRLPNAITISGKTIGRAFVVTEVAVVVYDQYDIIRKYHRGDVGGAYFTYTTSLHGAEVALVGYAIYAPDLSGVTKLVAAIAAAAVTALNMASEQLYQAHLRGIEKQLKNIDKKERYLAVRNLLVKDL